MTYAKERRDCERVESILFREGLRLRQAAEMNRDSSHIPDNDIKMAIMTYAGRSSPRCMSAEVPWIRQTPKSDEADDEEINHAIVLCGWKTPNGKTIWR